MKKVVSLKFLILLFAITITNNVVMAQTRFYKGNSTYSSDIIMNINGNRVYRGHSSYSSDILYNMDGPIPLPILMMIL